MAPHLPLVIVDYVYFYLNDYLSYISTYSLYLTSTTYNY